MLKNYFNAAIRFFAKNWSITTLNVIVFGVGLAACLLILNKVGYEFSYDKFYDNHENIYRVSLDHYYPHNTFQNSTATSFYPIGYELSNRYPEIKRYTKVSSKLTTVITVGDESFPENDFNVINPDFFKVFPLNIVSGDTIGIGEFNVFLSESLAIKLFGTSDAAGETVELAGGDLFKVKAVYEDIPANSHFHYNILLTISKNNDRLSNWKTYTLYTYVVLQDGVDADDMEDKLQQFSAEFSKISDQDNEAEYRWEAKLVPISDIFLYSDAEFELEPGGDIQSVYMLLVMAFLIVIISCFNYVNLTNSMYAKRVMEFFVRKVHGATALDLLKQYTFESVLLLLFGIALSVILLIVLPYVSEYTFSFADQPVLFYIGLCGIMLFTFFLSVLLPSSAFAFINPLKFANGEFVSNPVMKRLGKSLIVLQFVISFLLLAGSITIGKQLNYVSDKSPGINTSDVVTVNFTRYYYAGNRDLLHRFKNEIINLPGVESVSFAESVPGTTHVTDGSIRFRDEPEESGRLNYYQLISTDYFKTYGIEVLAGRVFDERSQADSVSILINEKMAADLGVKNYQDLIGEKVLMPYHGENRTFTIVGVTKNYYHESLKDEIKPIAFVPLILHGICNNASIRLSSKNQKETLALIKNAYLNYFNDFYALNFIEDNYSGFFNSYYELSNLIRTLALLAILLAAVGLFGLASNETAKRTKEVAIRKVNGANFGDIYMLFLKYFGKLIGIAFLFSIPVSFYFANDWLNNFAVRVNIGVWFFGLQVVITAIVAIISISYFLIKISLQNPIVSLRNKD